MERPVRPALDPDVEAPPFALPAGVRARRRLDTAPELIEDFSAIRTLPRRLVDEVDVDERRWSALIVNLFRRSVFYVRRRLG